MTTIEYRPKYLWHEDRFCEDYRMVVSAEGTISHIGPVSEKSSQNNSKNKIVLLPSEAIVPGLVNAHSHAFQRGLRGYTQNRGKNDQDNFWTWRESMYALVDQLTPEDVHTIAQFCYLEMLASGITSVGEFHYLHHGQGGEVYENPNELGHQVLRAAHHVGIRICLLDVAYGRAGFQNELRPAQKRFCDADVDFYLKRFQGLTIVDEKLQTKGMAPHSIRAIDATWLQGIADFVEKRELPVHMHLHEQPAELEACQQEYGKTPIEVLSDYGLLSQSFTAVHATHISPQDISRLAENKAFVCACPTTERDLGDGILPADQCMNQKITICLGSDSHVMINLWEDARELELHLRLQTLKRNILGDHPAAYLFQSASQSGAQSLGLTSGVLQETKPADFLTIDLDHLSLLGASQVNLMTQMMFSMERDAVKEVYVQGRKVYQRGHLEESHEQVVRQFRALLNRIHLP